MIMIITTKGGAQIRIPVDKFSTSRNPLDGSLTKLNWTRPAGADTRLAYVDLDQVAAIHCIEELQDVDTADAPGSGE